MPLLVLAEGIVHHGLELRPRVLGPFLDALEDQLLGRVDLVAEGDDLVHRPHDAQLAIEARQHQVAALAPGLDAILLLDKLQVGVDLLVGVLAELRRLDLQLGELIEQVLDQRVALLVLWLDHLQWYQTSLRVLDHPVFHVHHFNSPAPLARRVVVVILNPDS